MKVKVRRLLAIYIDGTIIEYIVGIPSKILYIKFDNICFNIILTIIDLVIVVLLFLYKDGIFGYESIGKKMTGLKIYKDNDRLTDKEILFRRNLKSFVELPSYIFDVISTNKSAGDNKYYTVVK